MAQEIFRDQGDLLGELRKIRDSRQDRQSALQAAADAMRWAGGYRWVGLYEVDHARGEVRNIVYSGPGAPEFPKFPTSKGLTGSAISGRKTVNVGDVAADPRYLTAFGSTRSEIIVPVFDKGHKQVVGTVDVESEAPNAFDAKAQKMLETCAETLAPLWH